MRTTILGNVLNPFDTLHVLNPFDILHVTSSHTEYIWIFYQVFSNNLFGDENHTYSYWKNVFRESYSMLLCKVKFSMKLFKNTLQDTVLVGLDSQDSGIVFWWADLKEFWHHSIANSTYLVIMCLLSCLSPVRNLSRKMPSS